MKDRIEIRRGSLLDQHDVEAIVNAANRSMRGGGGIDGAIHRGAGPGLLEELIKVAPKGCEAGEVVVTGAHNLPFRYIFHTPGPIWKGGEHGEPETLSACYRNCILEAEKQGLASIGFCSISTGVFGYPVREAAKVALRTLLDIEEGPERIVFAMFGNEEYAVFRETLRKLGNP
ncbi:MAG TPA: macro domain-containing protein [Fimbriimonadaceae bacterium]|nr:macro domain-containing protein [Fimbriimonadaceae bacterium]